MVDQLISPGTFSHLYAIFDAPITHLDCGLKCAPYNEKRVPFCCDIRHAVPTAYLSEWAFLKDNTDLWHLWQEQEDGRGELEKQTPDGQVLIACKGHEHCVREYRSLTCRSFPFFPYISRLGEFLGLSVYWEYSDRCWVISNLEQVSPEYLKQFVAAYEQLFALKPEEFENFHYHSKMMRRIFGRRKRRIPLLHRNGFAYLVSPGTGQMRRMPVGKLPKYEPYRTAGKLLFPDEK